MPRRIRVRACILGLLVNSATYPLWSMIRYYESLRSGREGLHDVGALRSFKTNAITVMREEVRDLVLAQADGLGTGSLGQESG